MRQRVIVRLVVMLSAAVSTASAVEASVGQVRDAAGKPIEGASVCLVVAGRDGLCATTDGDGAYNLPDSDVPAIRISKKGYLPSTVANVPQESPIVLEIAAVLFVRLVDVETRVAIPKGEVWFSYPSGERKGPLPCNSKGVRISTVRPGEVVVSARAEGYLETRTSPTRLTGGRETEVVVALRRQ